MPTKFNVFMNDLDVYSGMIDISILVHMLIDPSPFALINVMIITDTCGWLISRFTSVVALSNCSNSGIWLVADVFWCVKDAVKYAHIADRCGRLWNISAQRRLLLMKVCGLISALFYCIYIINTYYKVFMLDSVGQCMWPPVGTYNVTSIVLLYSAWSCMTLIAATTTTVYARTVLLAKTLPGQAKVIRKNLIRECLVLWVVVWCAFILWIYTIIKIYTNITTFGISGIVNVYSQIILYFTSHIAVRMRSYT